MEPAVGAGWIKLCWLPGEPSPFVKWSVGSVKWKEEKERGSMIIFDDTDGFVSNQIGRVPAIFRARNEVAITVPCEFKGTLAVPMVVHADRTGK